MSIGRRRFRILKEIAEGGFGKVYLAEQISSDGFSRIVAIKLLHAKWSNHDEIVKRTRDEARVLGRIRHQHIVKVEDLTSIEGKCAIVMEYLEGVDLKWMSSFLKDKKLEFAREALFEIMLAVASALDAAYNGVPLQGDQPLKAIHRDIKPSNVFVTVAGGVKVLDFGTARANFAEREAKTQALSFGSQGYMAPERMLGEEDTPAADIFSLGITLYELLTLDSFGRIPPRKEKFKKKIEERVAAVPLKGDPDWDRQVRDTLRQMLSYAPLERPSAAQLVEIMEGLAQGAKDTGLRRYCRTLVSEAKDALPPIETRDPLIGTIVDEDDSGSAPSLAPGPAEGTASSAPVIQPGTGAASRSSGRLSGPSSLSAPPPPAPENVKTVNPSIVPAEADTVRSVADVLRTSNGETPVVASAPPAVTPPAEVRPGGTRKRTIGVLLLGVMLIGLMIGAVFSVAVLAAMVAISAEGASARRGELSAGGRILTADGRSAPARVPTVLRYAEPAGALVEIRGPGGFSAEWDGLGPFDLGPAGEGVYQATVARSGLPKLRLKQFTVEAGKESCAFDFDPRAGEWTGGCR